MIVNARSPSSAQPPKKLSTRHRFTVASRVLAAIAGGYALAAGFTVATALALRGLPREEAVMLATLPSFLIWAGAVVWVFSARTALYAWVGVLVPGVGCALAIWWLRSGGAS
jgi:hypothetical protein